MCAYANSLPQSFLFKASHFSSKRSPQSLLPKAFPQSSFLQSSLFKAPSSKPSPSKPFSQSASLKALSLLFFLFKAPSSKPLPQSLPSKPFLSKPLAQSVSLKAFSFKASSSKLSPSKLLVQSLSLLLKALSSKPPPQSISSKLFPQSLLLKALSPKPFPSKPLTQSLLLLLKAFSFKAFFLQSFFFQSFLFEAFSSKGIKGSRNQTSCCETLTRRNLSATKSATYVHLGFPKILGAAVRREALLDKKTDSNSSFVRGLLGFTTFFPCVG